MRDKMLVAEQVQQGELEIALASCEDPPLPVHLISPHGRAVGAKARAFMDFAVPRLKSKLARLANDLANRGATTRW